MQFVYQQRVPVLVSDCRDVLDGYEQPEIKRLAAVYRNSVRCAPTADKINDGWMPCKSSLSYKKMDRTCLTEMSRKLSKH